MNVSAMCDFMDFADSAFSDINMEGILATRTYAPEIYDFLKRSTPIRMPSRLISVKMRNCTCENCQNGVTF